ncbi:MAG: iron-containing alcohol dehydrogenase [Balneolaceae bacterium]
MTNVKTIYGSGVLANELSNLNGYIVVTDKVPWELYKDHFQKKPLQVVTPDTLDMATLDRMLKTIPENVDFVGLGGGAVIDAAKYFAYLRNKSPLLIPTISSTNAPFSDFISITNENGYRFGFKKLGWPKRIIVDYELICKANPRFNRAGYGDLIFMQTTLDDWRLASEKGKGVPVDPKIEKTLEGMIAIALESATEIGSNSPRGIEILMKLIEDSTDLMMQNLSLPINAGSDHLFAWNLEVTTGRHFIHGEIVALGILISSFLHKKHYLELKDALDQANVTYLPKELDISWEEIKKTLLSMEEYNRKVRQFDTVFDEVVWTPELLNEIQALLFCNK